jgi:hypothetical protein
VCTVDDVVGEIPRRDFMKAAVTAMAVGGPALLAACGGGKNRGLLGGSTPSGSTSSSTFRSSSSSSSSSASHSQSSSGSGRPVGDPNVFRRSARHVRRPCNACVQHAKSRYYSSRAAALADPAHVGCNCEVTGQVISDAQLASMFKGNKTVFDQRSG